MNNNQHNASFHHDGSTSTDITPLHASFTSISSPALDALTQHEGCVVDLRVRRTISDSVLSLGSNLHHNNYNNMSTISMMVNRSGAKTVKQMIQTIHEKCQEQEFVSQLSSKAGITTERQRQCIEPPEKECCILAQWAPDSYYKVVITSRAGIPALLRAMKVFPAHRGIQECCCLALSHLCSQGSGGNNIHSVEAGGGVSLIILAMKQHPNSVAVQSAACEALRNLSGLLLWRVAPTESTAAASNETTQQLIQVLSHAKSMYLHPAHCRIAEALLEAVLSRSQDEANSSAAA